MCVILHEARLLWRDITIWNAVPWYTAGKNSGVDLEAGVDALCRLLGVLPKVRVVVTGGLTASDSWKRATWLRPELAKYPHIAGPHPSTRGLTRGSRQPIETGRAELKSVMSEAKQIAGIS